MVSVPTTVNGWQQLSEKFGSRWTFHHTKGAIDGRHIAIKCQKNLGSVYHNYKGFFSIILLGVVDASYKFVWVNVGANESTSDCAEFNKSDLKAALENNNNNNYITYIAPNPLCRLLKAHVYYYYYPV